MLISVNIHTLNHAFHAELYYQVSRDDADEDDDPIIKHSPLIEEQLAKARAEVEAGNEHSKTM